MTQQLLDKIASLKDALRQEQERRIDAERRLDGAPDMGRALSAAKNEVDKVRTEKANAIANKDREVRSAKNEADKLRQSIENAIVDRDNARNKAQRLEQEVQRLQGEVARIKAKYARKFGELQKQAERGETKSAEIAQYKRGLSRGNNKR